MTLHPDEQARELVARITDYLSSGLSKTLLNVPMAVLSLVSLSSFAHPQAQNSEGS